VKGQTIMQKDTLRSLIMRAFEALDPHHQGICWPNPIAWDGRPLREIASDLCAELDSQVEQATEIDDPSRIQELRELSDALWQRSVRARTRGRTRS
jgi:hypothetical protein